MAFYYNIVPCVGGEPICISAATQQTIGQVIEYNDGIRPVFGCYTITEEISDCVTGNGIQETYESCLDCITSISGYFLFRECSTNETYYLTETYPFTFVPQIGAIYRIDDERIPTYLCYTFNNYSESFEGTPFSEPVLYENDYLECGLCYNYIPYDANAENTICQQLCTESGTTVSVVSPPHPVWTNEYGTEITQNNMIVIGGPNGLNA